MTMECVTESHWIHEPDWLCAVEFLNDEDPEGKHEQGEAAIRASGIASTFIRPTGFMSNLLAWAHAIKTEGVVRSSTGDGRRPVDSL